MPNAAWVAGKKCMQNLGRATQTSMVLFGKNMSQLRPNGKVTQKAAFSDVVVAAAEEKCASFI